MRDLLLGHTAGHRSANRDSATKAGARQALSCVRGRCSPVCGAARAPDQLCRQQLERAPRSMAEAKSRWMAWSVETHTHTHTYTHVLIFITPRALD